MEAADSETTALAATVDNLQQKITNLLANVNSLMNQRDSARTELAGALLQIEDLQKRLAAKKGLGIASTVGDTHADIRQKIREGLADQQRFHKS